MKLPPFDYRCPATLAEAVDILAANPGAASPLAGGQTLIPILAFRLSDPAILVDLRRLPGLDRIDIDGDRIKIGSMVRWRDIEEHPVLRAACPVLPEAISHVAHYRIRNRGTVGGSLAHGDPATEMPAIAVLCDAEIHIAGRGGSREVPARSFFVGPLTTVLEPDELIVGLELSCWPPRLGLTGTHLGCEHGVCGACTVIVNGEAVRSCLMLAVQADGADVVTVEGLSSDSELSPLQAAFRKHHALQCGFCTPGMITTLHALLTDEPFADEERIRDVLSGNICRCTGYIPIIEAALEARAAYQLKADR